MPAQRTPARSSGALSRSQTVEADGPGRRRHREQQHRHQHQTQAVVELPVYVPPEAPLNTSAMTALEELKTRSAHVRQLQEAHKQALESLRDATSSLFDRAASYRDFYERGKAQLEELEKQSQDQERGRIKKNENEGQGDRNPVADAADGGNNIKDKIHAQRIKIKQRKDTADQINKRADQAYAMIEPKFRDLLDSKARLVERENVLGEVSGNIQHGNGRVAPTQNTQSTLGASQFRNDPMITDSPGSAPTDDQDDQNVGLNSTEGLGFFATFQEKLDTRATAYEKLSMHQRYAQNNDYIEFKRFVHDAKHPDDGVALAHANTWFQEEHQPLEQDASDDSMFPASNMPGAFPSPQRRGPPLPNERGGEGEGDEDSDIEVARERISTKCPITLVDMQDPITSPCNHNFEWAAIVDMLRLSSDRIGGTEQQQRRGRRTVTVTVGGEPAIRCPVGSCQERFTEAMLRRDAVMRRKIKRLQEQAMRAAEQEDADDQEEYDTDADPNGHSTGRRRRAISVGTDNSDLDDGTLDGSSSRRHGRIPAASSASKIKRELRSSLAAAPSGSSGATRTPRSVTLVEGEGDDMDQNY